MASGKAVRASKAAIVASSTVIPRFSRLISISTNEKESQVLERDCEELSQFESHCQAPSWNDLGILVDTYQPLIAEAINEQNEYSENKDLDSKWHSPLWQFCWRLRSDEWLRSQEPRRVFEFLTYVLTGWIEEGADEPEDLDVDVWQYHFGEGEITEDEAEAEIELCWQRMRFHPGYDPVEDAFSRLIVVDNPHSSKLYSRLVSGITQLYSTTRRPVMFLPQPKLASLLNCNQSLISRMLSRAQEEGILNLKSRGSKLSGLASTYLFVPERLPADIRAAYGFPASGCVVEFKPAEAV